MPTTPSDTTTRSLCTHACGRPHTRTQHTTHAHTRAHTRTLRSCARGCVNAACSQKCSHSGTQAGCHRPLTPLGRLANRSCEHLSSCLSLAPALTVAVLSVSSWSCVQEPCVAHARADLRTASGRRRHLRIAVRAAYALLCVAQACPYPRLACNNGQRGTVALSMKAKLRYSLEGSARIRAQGDH